MVRFAAVVAVAAIATTIVADAQNSPQDYVDLHNAARADVGVAPLVWDDTVAAYAAAFAAKRQGDCALVHSGGPYGENLFWGGGGGPGANRTGVYTVVGPGVNWTGVDALAAWVEEKQYYNCSDNSCADGKVCGHYTQVVWANTTRVGCARVICDGQRGTFVVCEYDPPGNIVGERPYAGGCRQFNRSGSGSHSAAPPPPPPSNPTLAPPPPPPPANPTPSPFCCVSDNGNGSIPKVSRDKSNAPILPIILPVVTVLGLVSAILVCIWRRSRLKRKRSCPIDSEDIQDLKSMLLDPYVIRAATQNFSEGNKLGKGGFGEVYKGLMPDGQEIAVKRLAKDSKQGLQELKNELLSVAKLQHRNLVKLIGACLDGHEKLLVYEYIPNKSLDSFIYDDEKRDELSWDTRYKIICGIARGLVYLHDESRVKVIHRDLKPSNILLEMDMNPKISDFGLASVFENDHSKHVTRRVAGTYGYMAPEYAVLGHVSTKSDVFSFGVIILEIVIRRRNSVSSSETMVAQHLLSYVWENWTSGTITETIDPSLRHSFAENMVLKCTHIGLLCVQENPSDRPNMSNVILMLVGRSTTLPAPSMPAFLFRLDDDTNQPHHGGKIDRPGCSNKPNLSFNMVTITKLEPR